MNVTMQSLARELGLSRTTVSLILKGEGDRYRISRDTQQRVLRKVQQTHYRPNYFAKALNHRQTAVVGIVFPNVFESFMGEMVKGIEEVLYPADYTMTLSTSRFDRRVEQRILEQFSYRGIDGLLLMFNAPFVGTRYSYGHLQKLMQAKLPVVFIDRYLDTIEAPSVVQDDFGGARDATRALVAAGCRRIASLTLNIDVSTIHHRIEGYHAALEEAGLKPARRIRLRTRDPKSSDLREAIDAMVRSKARPDGLFVTTNGIAYKAVHLLREHGLQLNHDIRVAKFGSDPEFHPTGMYCVTQPHVEMGRRAASALLHRISHPTARPRREVVAGTLTTP